jgi:hypothetical protein
MENGENYKIINIFLIFIIVSYGDQMYEDVVAKPCSRHG